MAKHTLIYFDVPGRAQTTRHLFSLGGIEFEDKRVGGESWMALKPDTPLKQLPVLHIDERVICQTSAIERYVAKLIGANGSNDAESAVIDMIHTSLSDMGSLVIPYFFGEVSKDEAKKAELKKSLVEEKFPVFLDLFTRKLEANGGDGFIVGDKVSLADVAFANFSGYLKQLDTEGVLAGKYPKLYALAGRVAALPAIKAFDEKHAKK